MTEEQIRQIVSAAQLAPSWKNSQTARYYAVLDKDLKERIAAEAAMQFSKNMNNIRNAAALVVLASKTGIAGYDPDGSFTTPLGTHWQSFDAGIACQTFCLAAHDLGLGTLIMGIFDPEKVAELAGLASDVIISVISVSGSAGSVRLTVSFPQPVSMQQRSSMPKPHCAAFLVQKNKRDSSQYHNLTFIIHDFRLIVK